MCCNCTDNKCLTMECACFSRGLLCKSECKCSGCLNKSITSEERIEALEKILMENSTAFTQTDSINQEEKTAIANFPIITVDDEPFEKKEKSSSLSRLLAPEVIEQAIKTIISAATKDVNLSKENNLEEHITNCVLCEFENVLSTVYNAIGSKGK